MCVSLTDRDGIEQLQKLLIWSLAPWLCFCSVLLLLQLQPLRCSPFQRNDNSNAMHCPVPSYMQERILGLEIAVRHVSGCGRISAPQTARGTCLAPPACCSSSLARCGQTACRGSYFPSLPLKILPIYRVSTVPRHEWIQSKIMALEVTYAPYSAHADLRLPLYELIQSKIRR